MAAATKTITRSRPIFVSEELPEDSKLNCLVMLAKVVSADVRRKLIKEGHKFISSAKTMKDLGYSEMTYCKRGSGHGTYFGTNTKNYRLTLMVLECDEGLYAHLLNKVSKMILDRTLTNKDHLGIWNVYLEWVYDALYPADESGEECRLGRAAVDAVVNYSNVMMGNI